MIIGAIILGFMCLHFDVFWELFWVWEQDPKPRWLFYVTRIIKRVAIWIKNWLDAPPGKNLIWFQPFYLKVFLYFLFLVTGLRF